MHTLYLYSDFQNEHNHIIYLIEPMYMTLQFHTNKISILKITFFIGYSLLHILVYILCLDDVQIKCCKKNSQKFQFECFKNVGSYNEDLCYVLYCLKNGFFQKVPLLKNIILDLHEAYADSYFSNMSFFHSTSLFLVTLFSCLKKFQFNPLSLLQMSCFQFIMFYFVN